MAQQELEAPVDRRHQRNERQCNDQPDKRFKRGVMRGSSAMRGGGDTGEREAAASHEVTQQTAGANTRQVH
jgi:hypothetical protein